MAYDAGNRKRRKDHKPRCGVLAACQQSSKHGEASNLNRKKGQNRRNPSETNTDSEERTKVSEVKIYLIPRGRGPADEFTSGLVGCEQDKLDVRQILENYGLKFLFEFNSNLGGVCFPILFDPESGWSIKSYKGGDIIHVHGDPKDPIVKPVTGIYVVVAAVIILATTGIWRNPPE